MSSLTRMLAILDLFDLDQPFWTSEQIMDRTGFSRPTTFRYLKELRQTGLLARFAGRYVLGAKAVKLDYIIRQSDPLLHLFHPILARLRDETECDVILASLLGNEFFATIHEQSENNSVSWPRGRPMPLTRGAGGLVVLASLPSNQLRRTLTLTLTPAEDPTDLRERIREVAKQGYAISLGALEPENVGIAIPLQLLGVPPAALILVMSSKRFSTSDPDAILKLLKLAREEMMFAYASIGPDVTND